MATKPSAAELEERKNALEKTFIDDEARQESKRFNQVSLQGIVDGDMSKLPESFEAAMALFADAGITVDTADATTVGDGFRNIDKEDLVNVPVLLLTWQLDSGQARMSEDGFLIVRAIIKGGDRVWFTCGGYGLFQELTMLSASRVKNGVNGTNAGLFLPKGLRADALPDYPGKYIYRCAI